MPLCILTLHDTLSSDDERRMSIARMQSADVWFAMRAESQGKVTIL